MPNRTGVPPPADAKTRRFENVQLALKEMGKEMTDPMIFEMLRHNDKEVATVLSKNTVCTSWVHEIDAPWYKSARPNSLRTKWKSLRYSPKPHFAPVCTSWVPEIEPPWYTSARPNSPQR